MVSKKHHPTGYFQGLYLIDQHKNQDFNAKAKDKNFYFRRTVYLKWNFVT